MAEVMKPMITELEYLPEHCIALVLSFLDPKDIAMLACTNRAFRSASLSDVVWQAKLPKDYTEVLMKAKDGARGFDSKKQIFDYLCSKVPLHGHEFYWLVRSPLGVCRSQGAEALGIAWGDDNQYWEWHQRGGSSYDKSAFLNRVWWLAANGSMECSLPVGTYTLSWRFALEGAFGFSDRSRPIEFAMSVNDHEVVRKEVLLKQSLSEAEHSSVDTDWKEFYVGDFTIEEGEKDSGIGRVNLRYSFDQTKNANLKGGLWVDGVVIKPKQQGVDVLHNDYAVATGTE